MTAAKGFVVPAGGGKHHASPTPGRFFDLKLFGRETGDSIMLFEETLPPGTRSLYHLHHESDEVAWVIAGELTFKIGDEIAVGGPGTCAFMPRTVPHAWKNTGSDTARVVSADRFGISFRQQPRGFARAEPMVRTTSLQRGVRCELAAPVVTVTTGLLVGAQVH